MSSRPLRLEKSAGDPDSDPRAWLDFALEAAGASRWEIAMPGGRFSLTELWQRMTGDPTATAIPRAELRRLRESLSALFEGERAEVAIGFLHAGRDGLARRRRSVIRLVAPDRLTGRPPRLWGLNFLEQATDGKGPGLPGTGG